MNEPSLNPNWAKLPIFDRSRWQSLRFGEFAQSINERVDPSDAAEDVYVGLEHLDPESLHIRRWGKGSDVIGTKLRFQKGDIIFGRRRAYQRKLATAEFDGICSAHAMVVRANPDVVLPEFLPFLMMSDRFMNRAVEISVGSLSPTINWKTLKQEEFALPPLDQQRRIAEILWAVDKVCEKYREAIVASEEYRKSHILHVMSRGIRGTELKETPLRQLPADWDARRIEDVGNAQLGRQRSPKYQTGTYSRPYLRVANVFDGTFDLSDLLEMDFDERDFKTYSLKAGDILLVEGHADVTQLGRPAMWTGQIEDCCFQNTLIRFQAGSSLLPEFAFALFRSEFYRGRFAAVGQFTSISHLSAGRFSKMLIPVPPIPEQRDIVGQLKSIETRMADLQNLISRLTIFQQRLRSSLLEEIPQGY